MPLHRFTGARAALVTALATALATALVMAVVVVSAPAASATTEHSPPWRWTTVSSNTFIGVGVQQDVTLSCPTGYRPISWTWDSSYGNTATTLTLQAQTLDYASNSGRLRVYNGTNHDDVVYASLNCVNGADLGTITTQTKVVSHTVGNTGGFQQCNLGTTMLGGSASWNVTGANTRLDFMAPTSSGWYATGNATAWVGQLTVQVHCVGLAVASGVHLEQATSSPDPNSDGLVTGSVSCASTERVANAGAYEAPDGESVSATKTLGAIRSISQYSNLPAKAYASVRATVPNSTTTLVVLALCVPYATPDVVLTATRTLLRPDIAYSFSATDPAGYDLTMSCDLWEQLTAVELDLYQHAPCLAGTSNSVTEIPDGRYYMNIIATNGDGQFDTTGFYFAVDTAAPVVTVTGKPADPTTTTSASFGVTATDPHPGSTYCSLDSESEQVCPSSADYAGLADGIHTFHWRAVDAAGNQTSGSYPWRVDTVAPSAALTAPTTPFASSTSTTVSWAGSDAGSGIASWQVQWQRAPYNGGFGAWSSATSFAAGTSSHAYTGLAPGYDYCYRVRSVDAAGNTSAYSPRRCSAIPLDDRAFTAPGWTRKTGSAYYAGTATSTSQRNATLTRSGVQLDGLALLATKCASCGKVGVYVGGALVGKVNLYASSTRNRQLIRLAPFSYRTGTVTIKVLTAGKLVRIDGVGFSRP